MPVSMTGELKAPGTGKSSIATTMPPKTQHWEHSSRVWGDLRKKLQVVVSCGQGARQPCLLAQRFPGLQAGWPPSRHHCHCPSPATGIRSSTISPMTSVNCGRTSSSSQPKAVSSDVNNEVIYYKTEPNLSPHFDTMNSCLSSFLIYNLVFPINFIAMTILFYFIF